MARALFDVSVFQDNLFRTGDVAWDAMESFRRRGLLEQSPAEASEETYEGRQDAQQRQNKRRAGR